MLGTNSTKGIFNGITTCITPVHNNDKWINKVNQDSNQLELA